MKRSKIINSLFIALLLSIVSCATAQYKANRKSDYFTEIITSPDRVLLECEPIDESNETAGFTISVLDEAKTVTNVIQGNVISRQLCDDRLIKIGKILEKGRKIRIRGHGTLDRAREKGVAYRFPKHGVAHDNGRVLQFSDISNETGMCHDAYTGSEKPCPQSADHIPFE
jgi:hypothetical protein